MTNAASVVVKHMIPLSLFIILLRIKNYCEWQDECGDTVLVDAHIQEIEADILFCTMLTIKHYCLSSLQSNVRQRHLMLLGNNLEHLCRARKKVMTFGN